MHHSVWNHIAPQVTKQLLASQQAITKRTLVDLAVSQYKADTYTKEKFDELNIAEINVRQVVGDILETDPIIGVPIDGVTNDLRDWARTLKYKVKLPRPCWCCAQACAVASPTRIHILKSAHPSWCAKNTQSFSFFS